MFNEIYWATRLSQLHSISEFLMVISFVLSVVFGFGYFITIFQEPDYIETFKKPLRYCLIIFSVGIVMCAIFPTKTDLALIYGWEALTSDTAKEVFEQVMERVKN